MNFYRVSVGEFDGEGTIITNVGYCRILLPKNGLLVVYEMSCCLWNIHAVCVCDIGPSGNI